MGGGAGCNSQVPGGVGGIGGSGLVLVRLNPVFVASNVWSLKKVFQEIKANNWGTPT